jgi:hypothetical protein
VSSTGRDDESLAPAEEGLRNHLVLLREDAPRADESLLPAVVQRAAWQRSLRSPARAVGRLVAALVAGLGLAVGLRRTGGGR